MTDKSSKKILRKETKIFAAKDVVTLKTLTFANIVACEEYLRQTNNTDPESLPVYSWISTTEQYLIGERFKFLGVTDCEKWKEKIIWRGLFQNLRKPTQKITRWLRRQHLPREFPSSSTTLQGLTCLSHNPLLIWWQKWRKIFFLQPHRL